MSQTSLCRFAELLHGLTDWQNAQHQNRVGQVGAAAAVAADSLTFGWIGARHYLYTARNKQFKRLRRGTWVNDPTDHSGDDEEEKGQDLEVRRSDARRLAVENRLRRQVPLNYGLKRYVLC